MKRWTFFAVAAVIFAGRAWADEPAPAADQSAAPAKVEAPAAEQTAAPAKVEAQAAGQIAGPAAEQTEAPAKVEAPAKPEAPAKAEPAVIPEPPVKEEPAPAPVKVKAPAKAKAKAEAEAVAETPAPAPAPSPAPAPAAAPAPKGFSPEERLNAEWVSLKDAAADATAGVSAAALDDLAAFIQRHPDAPMMGEAQLLLASLYQKQGDGKSAMVALLRYLYEHPGAKPALKAQSDLLALGDKLLSRKSRASLGDLVKIPEAANDSERLAVMLQKIVEGMGDTLFDSAVTEIRRYQVRFPDSPRLDSVQMTLGQLYDKNGKYPAALLAYRKVISVYPESPLYPAAQSSLGRIYGDALGDYQKAIDVYQELAEKYPNSPHALGALQRTAQLFSERLKQYELAVQIDEKIAKNFPKSEGALKALSDEALILRDRLGKTNEAIDAFRRLAESSQGAAAVQAYQNAAAIAHTAGEFKQEVDLRSAIATYFPESKEAANELFAAAEIADTNLHDLDKAIAIYKQIVQKFPNSKAKKKADEKLAKIDK